jgi:hypothetical protein
MTFGRHLSSKNPRDSQPAHVEEEDKTAQPLQSTGEERTKGDKVVLSGRDNNSTMQSEHTVQKTTQYWYHAFRSPRLEKSCPTNKDGVLFKKNLRLFWYTQYFNFRLLNAARLSPWGCQNIVFSKKLIPFD